jgi:hypothetical protein
VKRLRNYICLILLPVFYSISFSFSQSISSFKSENKWGFKQGDKTLIEPQYDTVFDFDITDRIALVGKLNTFKRSASLTKEIRKEYIYNYITPQNTKIYITLAELKEPVCDFIISKNPTSQYISGKNYFMANYSGKKVLFNKNGKQITDRSFDNVNFTKVDSFFTVETKDPVSGHSFVGLINWQGKQILPLNYSKISFNTFDTLIYTCTAGIRFNGSDDVYNYKGERLHVHTKHIQCASKNFTIFKLFESENSYIILDNKTGKEKSIKAEWIYYLKNDTIVLLDDDWFFYDLKTEKKAPFDKKLIKYLHLDE